MKIGLVCASLKPAPGEWWNSAAREYLKIVKEAVALGGGTPWLFDLRENRQILDLNDDANRINFLKSLHECDGMVLSLPCYWGSLSAPALRILDVIRKEIRPEIPLVAMFLGMDAPSTEGGESVTERIFKDHLFLQKYSVSIPNPRDIVSVSQAKKIRKSIQKLGAAVVVTAHSTQKSSAEREAMESIYG